MLTDPVPNLLFVAPVSGIGSHRAFGTIVRIAIGSLWCLHFVTSVATVASHPFRGLWRTKTRKVYNGTDTIRA